MKEVLREGRGWEREGRRKEEERVTTSQIDSHVDGNEEWKKAPKEEQ